MWTFDVIFVLLRLPYKRLIVLTSYGVHVASVAQMMREDGKPLPTYQRYPLQYLCSLRAYNLYSFFSIIFTRETLHLPLTTTTTNICRTCKEVKKHLLPGPVQASWIIRQVLSSIWRIFLDANCNTDTTVSSNAKLKGEEVFRQNE